VTAMACAIWKTPAQLLEGAGDFQVFDSPRTGGQYWISGTAVGEILPLNDHAKRLLTTWICEQRRAGDEIPKIRSRVLELIKSRQPLPIMSRMTLALQYLGLHITQLGDSLAVGADTDTDTLKLLAETESKSTQELSQLLHMLEESGLVHGSFYTSGEATVRPTVRGWQELDNLKRPRTDSAQAFVAMWFNELTSEAYSEGIELAVNATGYKAIRIDKKEHNNKIDDEILSEIRRSRFLIADFTCEPKNVRGGVYYEAGFAQGLGIPVIWTCKNSSLADLHFDTRQYSHLVWRTPADLLVQLKNRIGATIGDGPLPRL
jgi:DNA-binding PadR family transcriptional regulator